VPESRTPASAECVDKLGAMDMGITWAVDADAEVSSSEELARLRESMKTLAEGLGGQFIGNGSFAPRPR